jgi:heat shock protein HtpX
MLQTIAAQVARSQRRSWLVLAGLLVVWLGVGAGLGLLIDGRTGTEVGVAAAALLAVASVAYALTFGVRAVLSHAGTQRVEPGTYGDLATVVQDVANRAGLPPPTLYIVHDPSPNAFATGRGSRDAAITVTSGLLKEMNSAELEGVIAHEMSHIRNNDVRLLLIVSTAIALIGFLSSWAFQALWRMPDQSDDDDRAGLILLATAIILGVTSSLVAPLLQLALSRSRESLADATGAELAGSPTGLLSALGKLHQNQQALRKFNHVTASMYIDSPVARGGSWFDRLFDTHPPMIDRIVALERIAGIPESVIQAECPPIASSNTGENVELNEPGDIGKQIREVAAAIATVLGVIGSLVVFVVWPGVWWLAILALVLFIAAYAAGYQLARAWGEVVRTVAGLLLGSCTLAGAAALALTHFSIWALGSVAALIVAAIAVPRLAGWIAKALGAGQ